MRATRRVPILRRVASAAATSAASSPEHVVDELVRAKSLGHVGTMVYGRSGESLARRQPAASGFALCPDELTSPPKKTGESSPAPTPRRVRPELLSSHAGARLTRRNSHRRCDAGTAPRRSSDAYDEKD